MNELRRYPALNQPFELNSYGGRGALERALCSHLCARLRQAIAIRGRASMVVSGGTTPVALYSLLARQALDWSRVELTLADERWVPPADAASNEGLVRRTLLQGAAAPARFLPLKNAASSPCLGQAASERLLRALPERLDLVLLGMGEDGHTASLFPGAAELEWALHPDPRRACAAITPPGAPWSRLTLTLPRLLAAREIILQLYGATKWTVLQRALEPGPVEQMPVRALFRQRQVPVRVYWAP